MNWLRTAGVEESLSARRAWIEISDIKKTLQGFRVALRKESVDRNIIVLVALLMYSWSLSARRAWIEIFQANNQFKSN